MKPYPKISEAKLHRTIVKFAERYGLWFWHTPNGELRHPKIGRKLKRLGTLPGVSDLLIMEPWICTHPTITGGICDLCRSTEPDPTIGFGVAMEIKIWPNRLTDTQKAFLIEARRRGMLGVVVFDVDRAVSVFNLCRPPTTPFNVPACGEFKERF